MLDWQEDPRFERNLKEDLAKLTRKQKAEFALICAVRSLPLIGVKSFNYWKDSKKQDWLSSIFATVDIAAAVLLDMPDVDINFLFYTDVPDLCVITKADAEGYVRNAQKYGDHKPESVYAAAYAVQAVYYLSEVISLINNTFSISSDNPDEKLYIVTGSANAAFSAVFTGNDSYLVSEFQETLSSDIHNISANKKVSDESDRDSSLYDGIFESFLEYLRELGLGHWADIYRDLFHNNFRFSEVGLSLRVKEHMKKYAPPS